MNLRALMFLGVAGCIAQPALAQTPPATTPAAPASTTTSIDSVLASGYEVKSVIELSDAALKSMSSPGQTIYPSVVITLQKGTSVAVCELSTANWINLVQGSMTNASLCLIR
jgi:hypothetical protein